MPSVMLRLAVAAALLGGTSGLSALSTQAGANGNRHLSVGSWTIEDSADDGGRTVRLDRDVEDVHVGYEFWIPREADRIARIGDVRRLTCSHGGGETVRIDSAPAPEAARSDLVEGLTHCSVPADSQGAILDGLEAAYAAAWAWVVEERAAAAAGTMRVGPATGS